MTAALAAYMALNYDVVTKKVVEDDGETYYRCNIPALPGVIAYGDTLETAYQELNVAKRTWFEQCLRDGITIPKPAAERYSGRVTLRLPKELHQELAERARYNGTSLNTYLVTLLAANRPV